MNRNKQIDEMAKEIMKCSCVGSCLECEYATLAEDDCVCIEVKIAEGLYEKGYRKYYEVKNDFNVGDFCLYGFTDGSNSLAIVEIVNILNDKRGVAELKFHKVIKDNTGNEYFNYMLKSGGTMNGSFKYLMNITPKLETNNG